MRNISPTFLQKALANDRVVGSRLTFRDTRCMFTVLPNTDGSEIAGDHIGDTGEAYPNYGMSLEAAPAIAKLNNKILRVDCSTTKYLYPPGELFYRYDDPTSEAELTPWQYIDDGIYKSTGKSTIGIFVDEVNSIAHVFYQDSLDNHIHRLRFDGTTWTDDGIVLNTTGASLFRFNISPLSTTKLMLNAQEATPENKLIPYSQICFIDLAVDTNFLTAISDKKKVFAKIFHKITPPEATEIQQHFNFHAIEFEGKYHIFASEIQSNRPVYYVHTPDSNGGITSDPMPFLPMDAVDDDVFFKLGGVSIVNNNIWASGVFSRSYGRGMHIYSIGPGHWSLGRDMFITSGNESDDLRASPGGKILEINNKLYYVTQKRIYVADTPFISGNDDPAKKTIIDDPITVSLSSGSNARGVLTAALNEGTKIPNLIPNATVDLDLLCGGEYQHFGTFSVDAIRRNSPKTPVEISCSSSAMKKVSLWKSDASYDYWSQTKDIIDLKAEGVNAKVITGMARGVGTWSGDVSKVWPVSVNQDCILFTTKKSSRSHLTKGRFNTGVPGIGEYGKMGVVLNYFRETKSQAAIRLGIPDSEITEESYGNSYIGVYYRTDTKKFYVSHVVHSSEVSVVEIDYPVPEIDIYTNLWIGAMFKEGSFYVYFRIGDNGEWTKLPVEDLPFDSHPWSSFDNTGRAGILIGTFMAPLENLAFDDRTKLIPVKDNTGIPVGSVLVAGDEKMKIDGKSGFGLLATGVTLGMEGTVESYTRSYLSTAGSSLIDSNIKDIVVTNLQLDGYVIKNAKHIHIKKSLDTGQLVGSTPEYRLGTATPIMPLSPLVNTVTGLITPTKMYKADRIMLVFNGVRNTVSEAGQGWNWLNIGVNSASFLSVEFGQYVPGTGYVNPTLDTYRKWNNVRRSDFTQETVLLDPNDQNSLVDVLRLNLDPPIFIYPNARYGISVNAMTHETTQAVACSLKQIWSPNLTVAVKLDTNYVIYMNKNNTEQLVGLYEYSTLHMPVAIGAFEMINNINELSLLNFDKTSVECMNGIAMYKNFHDIRGTLSARIRGPQDDGSIVYQTLESDTKTKFTKGASEEIHIYPTYIVTRGFEGTLARAHPENSIGLVTEYTPTCDRFEYYSSDMDMRLHDIIAELAGKAGAAVISEKATGTNGEFYPDVLTISKTQQDDDDTVYPQYIDKHNGIVKFKLHGAHIGDVFGISIRNFDMDTGQFINPIQHCKCDYFFEKTGDNVWKFKQYGVYLTNYYVPDIFPIETDLNEKEVTLSFFGNAVSIWVENSFVYSHRINPNFEVLSKGDLRQERPSRFIGRRAANNPNFTADIEWIETDDRVDNYIFDMGKDGASIISDILKEKRVFFQEDHDNRLRLFRERKKINPGSPYSLSTKSQIIEDDIAAISNLVMDGIDIAHLYDEDLMREVGNVFHYGSLERPDERYEMILEMTRMLKDARGKRRTYLLGGAIDPRLEPQDIINAIVDTDETEKEIIVSNIQMVISSDADFDMEIEGYENAN